jgi:ABC-type multidrug transport system permease subunit
LPTFWLISNLPLASFFLYIYLLAIASTALAVMLGCSVEDPKLGQEMMPVLFVPQMLVAGLFVSPERMPDWWAWARYIFTLTYSVCIGLIREFGGGFYKGDDMCQDFLVSIEADPDSEWLYWMVTLILMAFFRRLVLYILRRKATKFF